MSARIALGLMPDGGYRIGIYCARCLSKFGATTLLAVLEHAPHDKAGTPWRWARVTRTASRGQVMFARVTEDVDAKWAKPGRAAELQCQRCRARPRVGFTKLTAEADRARAAGVSAVNV